MPAKMIPWSLPYRNTPWQLRHGRELLQEMQTRRSCRKFSDQPVSRDVIEILLEIAHSAPSGANQKPWHFVAINDPALKTRIRVAAEEIERENYNRRYPPQWLDVLELLGTTAEKPYLEIAPWLIILFRVNWIMHGSQKRKIYYPHESIGIMSGYLFMACHQLGLAALPFTPSPMRFLNKLCGRPDNESPVLVVPVGYPAKDAVVPDLVKKPLGEAVQWNTPCENAE